MKLAIVLTVAAIVPASAQLGNMKPAPTAAVKSGSVASPSPLQSIGTLEKEMDSRISTTGGGTPCVVVGPSRGLYVSGLGAVFTAEVELAPTPGTMGLLPGPNTINPEVKARTHKDKLAHLPMLEQTLREMALVLASSPAMKLADTDQVVVAARLVYRPWEDTTGLPGEIVARVDHRGGAPKVEVQ